MITRAELSRSESPFKEGLEPKSIPIIVLVGGKGRRMEAITQGEIPKVLVPASNGQILLDLSLGIFRKAGAENIILSVAHQKEKIIAHLQNEPMHTGVKISDQGEPNGIVDAVSKALKQFHINSDFIACDGDGFRFGFDIKHLIRGHARRKSLATAALALTNDPSKHYAPRLDSEGKILSFTKFPSAADPLPVPIHTGLILFSEEVISLFDKPRTDKAWDSLYDDLLATHRFYGVVMDNISYFNINTEDALLEMDDWLKRRGKLDSPPW